MAYDHRLEIQRTAYIEALGAGYERMAFPELQYAWLGQQGYTQSTRLARLAAWAAANNVAMTQASTTAGTLAPTPPTEGAVVQTSSAALHQNGAATVYTQLAAFPVAPTANNSAVLIMSCHDNGVGDRPSSVTIGGVEAENYLAAEHDTLSTRESCWYVQDLGAAPNSDVVITYATSTDRYQTFGVLECTPLAEAPLDQARGTYWYDAGGWPQVISLPGPTTQANELLVAMTICGSGQPDINITSPADTGYTNLFKEIDSNTYQGGQASYKILTATETSTATWNNTAATSDHWSTVMASFKFA